MRKHLKDVKELTELIYKGSTFQQRGQLDQRPQGRNVPRIFAEQQRGLYG